MKPSARRNTAADGCPSSSGPGLWTFWERLTGSLVLLLVVQLLLWPQIIAPRFGRVFTDLLGAGHPLPAATGVVVHTGVVAWLALLPLTTMAYAWRGNLSRSRRRVALGSAFATGMVAHLFCAFAVLMPLSQLVLSLPRR